MKTDDLSATVKLYQEDAYLTSGFGTVLLCDGTDVVLDQTVFYAESGGQAADTGTIADQQVVGVRKHGGRTHTLPSGETTQIATITVHELGRAAAWAVGTKVEMHIDWNRRYHNMQMHSLAHFLFHAAGEYFEKTGQERRTKGAYIEGDSARFDFVGTVAAEHVPGIEERVRELLNEAGEATTERLGNDVFLWRSGEIVIPCGGTHVAHAGEIDGTVSLRRRSKGAGLTRLYVSLDRPA